MQAEPSEAPALEAPTLEAPTLEAPTLDAVIDTTDIYDPASVRDAYTAFVCDEFRRAIDKDGARGVSPETEAAVWAMIDEALISGRTPEERLTRMQALLTADAIELENHPCRDAAGNEMWGAAIDRLRKFEAKLKAKRRPRST